MLWLTLSTGPLLTSLPLPLGPIVAGNCPWTMGLNKVECLSFMQQTSPWEYLPGVVSLQQQVQDCLSPPTPCCAEEAPF